jgi:hypothetical protein
MLSESRRAATAGRAHRDLRYSLAYKRNPPRSRFKRTAARARLKWWKGRESNPRPRHYEESGRHNNHLLSITYAGSCRHIRKIRPRWTRIIPVNPARIPPRSITPVAHQHVLVDFERTTTADFRHLAAPLMIRIGPDRTIGKSQPTPAGQTSKPSAPCRPLRGRRPTCSVPANAKAPSLIGLLESG